jgi:hypothetical protein
MEDPLGDLELRVVLLHSFRQDFLVLHCDGLGLGTAVLKGVRGLFLTQQLLIVGVHLLNGLLMLRLDANRPSRENEHVYSLCFAKVDINFLVQLRLTYHDLFLLPFFLLFRFLLCNVIGEL